MVSAIRGLLFISEGNIEIIKDYCVPFLKDDPQDIIMDAIEKSGDTEYCFGDPFYGDTNKEFKRDDTFVDDNLPF